MKPGKNTFTIAGQSVQAPWHAKIVRLERAGVVGKLVASPLRSIQPIIGGLVSHCPDAEAKKFVQVDLPAENDGIRAVFWSRLSELGSLRMSLGDFGMLIVGMLL